TNTTGHTELLIDRDLFENKAHIIIKYWIYGEIYSGYIDLTSSTEEQFIPIKLNYTLLQRKYRVLNEYMKPLNGTFLLTYEDGKKLINIIEGKIVSGTMYINYTEHMLLFNNELANKYVLLIMVENETIKAKLSEIKNNTIIVDTENPLIEIIEKKATYNEETNTLTIILQLKVTDGIYSKKVYLNGFINVNNRTTRFGIERINTTNDNHTIVTYYVMKTTILYINIDKTIDIYITATDPSGKSSTIKTEVSIEIDVTSQTINQKENITTTQSKTSTTTTIEEIPSNETFIPNNTIASEGDSSNILLITITIALILLTIYLDFKYFRRFHHEE
ncbi:MAG: hypothetical protein J7L82_06600, partial [Staphylothermus sp.]|nr:hypothetical protein [Staphylothermus sp.]